jgi:hypothetical protein
MFARTGILTLDGLDGSGADWLERFKPYIQDGKTIVVAPHRVFGPETNDLNLRPPFGDRAYSPSLSPTASRIAARCKRWNTCARLSGVWGWRFSSHHCASAICAPAR